MNYKFFEYIIISFVIFELFFSVITLNFYSFFICILTIYFIKLVPKILKDYKFKIPLELQFFIILFIFATLFLGEIKDFYNLYWWWDMLLHFSSSMALAILSFAILLRLLRNDKIKFSASLISIFSVLITLGIGAIWEIFEFLMDYFFGLNMQKSGLLDTMLDLIMALLGSIIVSISGYFYIKLNKINYITNLIVNSFNKIKK